MQVQVYMPKGPRCTYKNGKADTRESYEKYMMNNLYII